MKTFFDITVTIVLGTLLLAPLLVIAVGIRLTSTGPALHWSLRMGAGGVPFSMPKFRTMYVDTPLRPTEHLDNPNQYITPVGKFLRKTSLDELPQLYSVLRGQMSLVGPRPVLTTQADLIESRRAAGVLELRPGITGWAQINGRDDITMEEKVRLDKEYLERRSLKFDLTIIWRTFFYVLSSKGVWH